MPGTALPDNCFRGIENPKLILRKASSVYVRGDLFGFRSTSDEGDGWLKESINWEDNANVLEFTFQQKNNDGTLQFRGGIAIIPLSGLHRLKKTFCGGGHFNYKRDPTDVNPYHGNLLLKQDTDNADKKMLRSSLAVLAEIHLREDLESKEQ
jgi:hypothetical protein